MNRRRLIEREKVKEKMIEGKYRKENDCDRIEYILQMEQVK